MRIVLPAAILALSLGAPAAATTVLFPPAGSNSFIALYETDSGNQLCDITCTLVASPTRSVELPATTISNAPFSISAGGSVTPTAIRGFVNSDTDAAVLDLAFRDTYTVVGGGTDPFDVTARMHVTGSIGAVKVGNTGLFQAIASIFGTIGNFSIDPGPLGTVPTVHAFAPSTRQGVFVNEVRASDFVVPVAFDVLYTRTVLPGDVFDVGWMMTGSASFRGEVDFQNTGAISFDTPDGVHLMAASGARFGDVPTAAVPEPSAWALMIAGFGVAGATMRARRRQQPA